jgi:hypothetical protein
MNTVIFSIIDSIAQLLMVAPFNYYVGLIVLYALLDIIFIQILGGHRK